MMEIIGYVLGFSILIAFLYFMWIDTQPTEHKPQHEK